tara:strand:- start:2335 stop:2619 length:285 start_codon:yes stop_codon:yes gene_type:complete
MVNASDMNLSIKKANPEGGFNVYVPESERLVRWAPTLNESVQDLTNIIRPDLHPNLENVTADVLIRFRDEVAANFNREMQRRLDNPTLPPELRL